MKFQYILFTSLGVLLAIIGGFIFYLFQNVDQSTTNKKWEVHSQEVLKYVELLERSNETQQSILRAYQGTGNYIFIEDFRVSSSEFKLKADELKTLVSDNPEQTALVLSILIKFTDKIDVFEKIVREVWVDESSPTVVSMYDEYQKLEILIAEYCATMKSNEVDLLDERSQDFVANIQRSKMVIVLLCFLLAIVLFFTFRYSYQNYAAIEKVRDELSEANADLNLYKTRINQALLDSKVAVYDWADITKEDFWMSESLTLMLGHEKITSDFNVIVFFEEHMHPEDKTRVQGILEAAIAEQKPYFAEYRLVNSNGEYTHFKATGIIYERDNVQGMIGAVMNIESEYLQRQERERIIEKWQEFSIRFDLTLDSSSYGVWDWLNIQSPNQWWSDTFYELLGYTREEFSPSIDSFEKLLHPDDLDKMKTSIAENLETGEQLSIEYRLRTKARGFRWFRAAGNHIKDPETGDIRMIGVVSDISREKLFTEELERSNSELENFAYVASHDLQEPLRKIQAFGDRLKFIYDQSEEELPGTEIIDKMNNAATRMRVLIQDLLNYSRVSRENRYVDEVDMRDLLVEVKDFLSERINETNSIFHIQEDLPILKKCNRGNMFQLFQNLISNAIKFQPENNIPEITIKATVIQLTEAMSISPALALYKHYYRIEVTDNGIGFKEEYLSKIFTIFQRLHGRSEYQGTGLGLAVSRKICENHNGFITAESEPNKGTTFIIILPKI